MRYYSIQRPVMPGGFPKKAAVEKIENFDTKTFCEEIGREAWGYIEYEEPLAEGEADAYELTRAGVKPYWCVTTTFDDRGRTTAAITSCIVAPLKPDATMVSTRRKDIYDDWFDSQEEAEKFTEEVKRA